MKPFQNKPPKGAKPLKNNIKQLVLLKIQIDAMKRVYRRYDELLQVVAVSKTLPSKCHIDGTTWAIQLHDMFKDSNTAWKSVAQRRFDLIITKE